MIKKSSILLSLFPLYTFSLTNEIINELSIIDSLSEKGVHYESFLRSKKLYNKNPNNIQVICRMAEANFIKAQNESNLDKQKKIFYRGFDYAKKWSCCSFQDNFQSVLRQSKTYHFFL